jgi:hypothetical protein
VQKRDPLGVLSAAPVFEIPFKSRFGHFRYLNSNGKELQLDPSLNNFLFKENGASDLPDACFTLQVLFMIPDIHRDSNKIFPNPKSYDIKTDAFRQNIF